MFWFAVYYLIGVILNGAYVVYTEFKKANPPEDTLLVGIVRVGMFLLGCTYWPLFWGIVIYDKITGRRPA